MEHLVSKLRHIWRSKFRGISYLQRVYGHHYWCAMWFSLLAQLIKILFSGRYFKETSIAEATTLFLSIDVLLYIRLEFHPEEICRKIYGYFSDIKNYLRFKLGNQMMRLWGDAMMLLIA